MRKISLALFFGFCFLSVGAQIIRPDRNNGVFKSDSTSFNDEVKVKLDGKTSYKDYKIISLKNDTTFVDTTLTLKKDFIHNYIRKDNFELLPFHNQGQTFNKLGYSFENNSVIPDMGFTAKQYNYKKVEDIYYYYVPTPTSELMYRTGLEQGQVLDAFITMNTSRQFNFSFAYKGLRSLGKYRHALASHGNFRTTFNYHTKNKRYYLRGHFSSFDFFNEENGGLTDYSILLFENNDSNFRDRGRLEVNFTNADNMYEGKRYFLDHNFMIFSNKTKIEEHNTVIEKNFKKYDALIKLVNTLKKDTLALKIDSLAVKKLEKIDSISQLASSINIDSSQFIKYTKNKEFDIKVGHSFMYESKYYRYKQTSATSIFGDVVESRISDNTSFQQTNNEVYAQLNSAYTGMLKAKINYYNYNYHYNSILFYETETIPNKLDGNALAFGAEWKTIYDNIFLEADASSIISGDLTGSSIKAAAGFKKDSIFSFKGLAEFTSKSPEFNKRLYQSSYKNYNWYTHFNNEKITSIGFEFDSNKWGKIKASYNLIKDYTYFNDESRPTQASETLNYIKIKASKSFTYGRFTLDNTIMYQNVVKGESFFRVPELVTQNTLYYSNHVFKGKPMYLQTGVTLKYFTEYRSNAYNPLISEFVIQNDTKIGNYPILDFFVNAQVRRTRLFLKVENFSASFTGRNYYSAPSYPYRDLTVRFGLVWNFFI
ncbi:putative porin [Lutibacter sp. B1]|uniref:putative porin n=1 Tax=Lutibacter sp. B1 TaxID=2725996 RepID=UPI001456E030|nr:putative porin [Lutibacter sp. B1]NLP58854.1 putative porin [Lutibacter sp. B1]